MKNLCKVFSGDGGSHVGSSSSDGEFLTLLIYSILKIFYVIIKKIRCVLSSTTILLKESNEKRKFSLCTEKNGKPW